MTALDPGVDPRIARTREVVVAATAALLAEAGFERITIEAIAERSGVARSTIYRNWPERADLLIEGFDRLCFFEDPPDLGSLEAELHALGTMLATGLKTQEWGEALASLIGSASHDPALKAAQDRFSEQRRASVAEVFERAKDRGELRSGADPRDMAELFASRFFFRHLMTDQPIDDAFVDAQVAAIIRLSSD